MSRAGKIATVFFSVLILPVAVVSMASLLIKLTTFPFIWERKQVKIQSQQTWDTFNQFNQAFQRGQYDQAIQMFSQQPELGKRQEVYQTLFASINQTINLGHSWQEIQIPLRFLNVNDASRLIDLAVNLALSQGFKNNYFISASDIMNFIKESLRNKNVANIEFCYKNLLSNVLQLDPNEDILFNLLKMDIADHLIRSLIQLKTFHAKDGLERTLLTAEQTVLRHSLFELRKNYDIYYPIFISSDSMLKISRLVQNIRDLNQIGCQALNTVNALLMQAPTNQQDKWTAIRSEFVKFQDSLNKLKRASADEGENIYIKSVQEMYSQMIQFIDSLSRASSAEEIQKYAEQASPSLEEQVNNFKGLFTPITVSNFQMPLDAFLKLLSQKKLTDLVIFTEKMNSFLMISMTQTAMGMFQKIC